MEVEIFTVCDFAQDNAGKLTIVGTFDRIHATTFPYIHRSLSTVVRLRFANKEEGSHAFALNFKEKNGKDVIPQFNGNIHIVKSPDSEYVSINLILNLDQIKFDNPGLYKIELHIDGEWVTGFTLSVIKA